MFIASLTYTVSIEQIDALLEAHVAFLKEQYAKGIFLASGRKNPRNGGVIMGRCASREEFEAVLAQDPFHKNNAARYDIIEFAPTMVAEGLESLLEKS